MMKAAFTIPSSCMPVAAPRALLRDKNSASRACACQSREKRAHAHAHTTRTVEWRRRAQAPRTAHAAAPNSGASRHDTAQNSINNKAEGLT